MAKDDYDVIVCNILVYLYKWLKKKTRIAKNIPGAAGIAALFM